MPKVALCDVRGPLIDLIEKLSGEEGGEWLEYLKRMLRKESQTTVSNLPVWKTITLGLRQSPSAYREALKANGYRIGDYADQILNKVKVSETETQLDLVVKTVAELGFKDGARRDAIYARAKELGLELCPAEVGPALRLAYSAQPSGEWLLIAMEPIAVSDGDLGVFGVVHDRDERWLHGSYGDPDSFWSADYRWVFVAPRK